jgi:hypothetical protein
MHVFGLVKQFAAAKPADLTGQHRFPNPFSQKRIYNVVVNNLKGTLS